MSNFIQKGGKVPKLPVFQYTYFCFEINKKIIFKLDNYLKNINLSLHMLTATLVLIILAPSIQKNLREIATSIAHAQIVRLRGAAEKLLTSKLCNIYILIKR